MKVVSFTIVMVSTYISLLAATETINEECPRIYRTTNESAEISEKLVNAVLFSATSSTHQGTMHIPGMLVNKSITHIG